MKQVLSPPLRKPVPVAVAVSGSGRSLENFLTVQDQYPFRVCAVIASRTDCRGYDIATEHQLPVFVDSFSKAQTDSNELTERLYQFLDQHHIHFVALAGFLKLFPLHPQWQRRVINIHPALLPRFGGQGMYGDRVHAAVLSAGETTTGATVHFVDGCYDEGDIIAQTKVRVLPTDDPASLAKRVFQAECSLYPRVLAELILGNLPLPSGTAWF